MQLLKYIEDKFELFPLRVKIEIFLFPLLIIFFVVLFFYDEESNQSKNIKQNLDIKSIKMNESFVDILKKIESFALQNKIELESVYKNENSLDIVIDSNLEKNIKFLKYIESMNSFSKVEFMELLEDKLNIQISFNRFYKKDLDEKTEPTIKKEKEDKKFKISAIIGDSAFINKKWLKVDENIGLYKLVSIEKNRVLLLSNENIQIELKLHKNERD